MAGRRRISRRESLKAVGASIALNTSSIPGNLQSRTVTVVTHKIGDGILKTSDVPASWWQQMNEAKGVYKKLQQRYNLVPAIKDVSLGVREKRTDGFRLGAVYVTRKKDAKSAPSIPDAVDGIEVRLRDGIKGGIDSQDVESTSLNCYTDPYDPVEGGVGFCSPSQCGSIGSRVRDSNYNEYLITAGHVFEMCSSGQLGDRANQGFNDIGKVVDYDPTRDMAVIGQDSQVDIQYGYTDEIVDSPGTAEGRVTENGVSVLMGDETEVYKVGAKTCRTSGRITDMYVSNSSCTGTGQHFIDTNIQNDGGDSCGPVFDEWYDSNFNRYVCSIVGIITNHGGITSSTYDIYDTHGYMFN